MKKAVLVMLALMVLLASPVARAGGSDPAAVAHMFTDAVAAGDFMAALDLCACDMRANGFDFVDAVDRLQSYHPNLTEMPAPEGWQGINETVARGRMATSLYMFAVSFLVEPDMLAKAQAPVDAAWATEYAAQTDPSRLEGLRLLALIDPEQADKEWTRELFDRQAAIYGADERCEKLALYALGDALYVGGISFLRYSGEWYVAGLASALAGTNAMGAVTPVPEAEHGAALVAFGLQ